MLTLTVAALLAPSNATTPSGEAELWRIIDRHAAQFGSFKCTVDKKTTKIDQKTGKSVDNGATQDIVVWDGSRFRLFKRDGVSTGNEPTKKEAFETESELIAGPNMFLQLSRTFDKPVQGLISVVKPASFEHWRERAAGWSGFAVTKGLIGGTGGSSLKELRTAAITEVLTAEVSGSTRRGIKLSSIWGAFTFWVAEDVGAIVGVDADRTASNLERIAKFISEQEGRTVKNSLRSTKTRVRVLAFNPFRGGVSPVRMEEVRELETLQGQRTMFRTASTMKWDGDSSITDVDFEPKIPIANGTPVNAMDSPNIHYTWQDGKIVTTVNDQAVDAIAQAKFQADRKSTLRTGLWVAGAAAAAATLLVVWKKFKP